MAAGFDPKTSHVLVLLAIDKAALWQVLLQEL
jgi:hypothetical protein